MIFLILVSLFVAIATSVVICIKYLDGYWERRGVFTYRPKNREENLVLETYKSLKAKGLKYGAYVKFYRPFLMSTDLDEIKAILIKDSDHFINRGTYINRKLDPMSASLPSLENAEWKSVRSILSPIFSSGKLKMIFPNIAAHAKIMQEVLAENAETNEPFESKDMAKRFGMDSMGSCTFGFEINTLKGHNQEFQDLVKNLLIVDWKKIAQNVINKNILKLLRIKFSNPKLNRYVQTMIDDTVEYREKNNIKRNDIFQYVQQITDENIDDYDLFRDKKLCKMQMYIALQTFFVGGFETASTLTSFAMFLLASNQEKQDKLRKNIREVLNKHGDLTYDALMEMDYLDWVINESLRRYPPAQSVSRYCNKTYKLPNSDIVVYPGEFVSVPIMGIHNDPEYYPNPEAFEPERFSPENKAKRHPMTFLPFGDGPRNCIGARLGQIIAKVAVYAAVANFKITLSEKTSNPLRFKKKSLFLEVEGGVWLNCSKVN